MDNNNSNNITSKGQKPFLAIAYFILISSLIPVEGYADNPFSNFGKQLEHAVEQGIRDGLNQARVPVRPAANQPFSQLLGGFSNAIPPYQDPGPDINFDEDTSTVLVGNVRIKKFDQTQSAIQLDATGNLQNPGISADSIAASVQWRCFGVLRDKDRPSYMNYLMGSPWKTGLASTFDARKRDLLTRNINDRIQKINQSLSGESPDIQFARMSTVYGRGADASQRRELKIEQMKRQSLYAASEDSVGIAAAIISLNPSSIAAGQQALNIVRKVHAEVGPENVSQTAECGLAYLEDRYGSLSDQEVIGRYETILAKGSTNPLVAPLNCPIAVSLANTYLQTGNYNAAYRVIDSARNSANLSFVPGDARARVFPLRDCEYVHWIDGMLRYIGLGTVRSTESAAESFRQCSDRVDACSFNLALLQISGETPINDPLEPARLLQQAARSSDSRLRAQASELLKDHFTDGQQLAAKVPKAFLQYAMTTAAVIAACKADETCNKFTKSSGHYSSTSSSYEQKCVDSNWLTGTEAAVHSAFGGCFD